MKIKILAKDIKSTSYYNYKNCAITKALRRAGLKNFFDVGDGIYNDETDECIINSNNKNYDKLVRKVLNMYDKVDIPVDFTVDLPLAKFRPKKK